MAYHFESCYNKKPEKDRKNIATLLVYKIIINSRFDLVFSSIAHYTHFNFIGLVNLYLYNEICLRCRLPFKPN